MSHSRKQSVHEPARLRRLAPVKSFAEKPEAVAAGILDEVIIARRAPSHFRSPACGGAEGWGCATIRLPMRSGPCAPVDLVGHAAPAKTPRRTSGTSAVTSSAGSAWGNSRSGRRFFVSGCEGRSRAASPSIGGSTSARSGR